MEKLTFCQKLSAHAQLVVTLQLGRPENVGDIALEVVDVEPQTNVVLAAPGDEVGGALAHASRRVFDRTALAGNWQIALAPREDLSPHILEHFVPVNL